ncbi:universal stress protein [Streptomyces sp. NBC_00243]|uniref:universal stress protein n=1 Tax=Streptomyces sp. NBC_00243 TaxID=2975688 RepID=UPI002DDAE3DA|nr:universal stress protein [Streptomyces sp. NBC_00243]WRZ18048.1 universal stress protein [Streptomyces sp. NBC_00243]
MQRLITVGIDGSPESSDAANWAAREALRRGLALRLLYAGDDTSRTTHLPELDAPSQQAQYSVARITREVIDAHPTLEILEQRSPEPAIPALLVAAEQSQALVLGSRGFTGFAGYMVGSVSLAVTARARRPVVLVRAGDLPENEHVTDVEGMPSTRTPLRPVVLGLDLSHPSDDLIAYACDAAATRRTALHVIHAWSLVPRSPYAPDVPTAEAETAPDIEKERLLAATLRTWRHKFPETEVTEQMSRGRAGHHLLKASADAGLLVIGRRIESGPRLGPTAHSVIHHVTCPVAVIAHT